MVVLARGGGSRSDLVAFDHELVARAIASCESPVFTGVGHETDHSVADEMAHTACSTPTAAARAVVQQVQDWLERLDSTGRLIATRGRNTLDAAQLRTGAATAETSRRARRGASRAETNLDVAAQRLAATGRTATTHAQHNLDTTAQRLAATGRTAGSRASGHVSSVGNRISHAAPAVPRRAADRLKRASTRLSLAGSHEIRHAQRHLDAAATRVRALDPALILRRGWSLTRRDDGTLLRSARAVAPGDEIVTHFADGTLRSTVRDGDPSR